jgi:hypothetical protein
MVYLLLAVVVGCASTSILLEARNASCRCLYSDGSSMTLRCLFDVDARSTISTPSRPVKAKTHDVGKLLRIFTPAWRERGRYNDLKNIWRFDRKPPYPIE